MIVDGHQIKLNFPVEPNGSAINDIKRMMLGGVAKVRKTFIRTFAVFDQVLR
ncbi:MAG: hypothetical protein FWE32_08770 [Oscillospiraceae bacterium]|nr:hypothetical protein [Oscillospiraceae bacterium]